MRAPLIVLALAACAQEPAKQPANEPAKTALTPGQAALRAALCATGPTPEHAASLEWLELPPCA